MNDEITETGVEETSQNTDNGKKKKVSGWSYERHIVPCPVCGEDILDHMTTCPHCKSEITIGGVKPMSQETIKKVRLIALIVGVIIALVIIVPILMKKFGGA